MSWISLGLGIAGAVFGGSKQSSAAQAQANASNAATDRQYEYDLHLLHQ